MINYVSKGSNGDIIYSLPSVMVNGKGNYFFRKPEHYNNLKALLELQPYINSTDIYLNQHIDVNFDLFRNIHAKEPSKLLTTCHLEVVSKQFDMSTPWLFNINPMPLGELSISWTPRYHLEPIEFNWKALKPFENKCIFIGHKRELKLFNKTYGLNLKRKDMKDALEMAKIIKGSKLFIGNQSLCYSLSFGLQHSRTLERYTPKDNCFYKTDNSFDYLDEELLTKYLTS